MRVIDEIRRADGFRNGIYMITVDTIQGDKKLSRRIDLRKMTFREAETTTFSGGTKIYVIEGPLFELRMP